MHRRKILGCLLACLLAASAMAQTTYTWTGLVGDSSFTSPGNWQGNVAPTGLATDNIIFPNLPPNQQAPAFVTANFNTPTSVGNVTFDGNYFSFYLGGTGPVELNGNVTANNVGSVTVPVVLTAGNHTFSGNSYVFQTGNLSGSGGIIMNGPGALTLYGANNTYTGGTTLNDGYLFVNSNTSLGTGAVTLNGGLLIAASATSITLANNFLLGATVNFASNILSFYIGNNSSTLAPVATGATSVNLNVGDYAGSPITIAGALSDGSGAATYTFSNVGYYSTSFHLTGTNTYTGGTLVKSGATVFFDTTGSVPATGLIATEADGYAAAGSNLVLATLLSRLGPTSFAGTLGLDNGDTYTGAINLSGFTAGGGSASLGTQSSAILTGLITPSTTSNEYRFRSSGTITLAGSNPLSGANGLVSLSLPDNPRGLLVLSQSVPNTYSGATTADGAGIIFDSAGSLSASTSLRLLNGGYVSYTDTSGLTLANLISQVSLQQGPDSVLGIDTHAAIFDANYTLSTYATNIDLSSLPLPVYIGTASNVLVSGSITTTNAGTGPYLLTGYRGGSLEVSSQLSGSRALFVGLFGDNMAGDEGSKVTLSNVANTYSGGTYFYSGKLIANNPASLGTGTIFVDAPEGYGSVRLNTTGTLANPINLVSGMLVFEPSGPLTLSGVISGNGGIEVDNGSTLTLSGSNTYAGASIFIGIDVTASTNTALGLGSGDLQLVQGSRVLFTSSAPVLGNLVQGDGYDDGDGFVISASLILAGGSTLTLNQVDDGGFEGAIVQTGAGAAVIKNGAGRLHLGGLIDEDNIYTDRYSGGTTINAGTLIAGSANALGPGPITLNGGNLGMDPGIVLANNIVFGASGGTLTGHGIFNTPITAGTNVSLAPGESPGTLTFASGLTLAPGGQLNFEVQYATGAPGTGYDLVDVSSGLLAITATAGTPFTLNIISLDSFGLAGNVSDFNSAIGYTWMIFQGNAVAGLTGYAASNFSLNTASFSNGLNGGVFYLTQGANGANPAIYLNFAPVPEPSTYALLAAGLLPVLTGLRRRRRN